MQYLFKRHAFNQWLRLYAVFFVGILLFANTAKSKESTPLQNIKLMRTIDVSMGLEYLGFYAGGTHIGGLISSINLKNTNIIAKNYILEFWFKIGVGPQKINGNYFIGSSAPLSNLTSFRGAGAILEEIAGKFGYNVTRNTDKPLFASFGFEYSIYTHTSIYSPYNTSINYNNILISLDGATRLGGSRWSVDYGLFGSYSPTLITFFGHDVESSKRYFLNKNIKTQSVFAHGFGIKANVGFSYAISKKVFFFTRFIAKYQYTLPSTSTTITTVSNPSLNEVIPSTSAQVAYPHAQAIYAGVRFGLGF